MKKTSIVLLLVLALALIDVMVSCKNEISAPADELVSVSFEEADASRSLTATLEAFDKDNYYWKYAADKADDSGLTSGETATYDEAGALPVSNGNKGLRSVSDDKPYKVPGFSQGLWNFKLYAYRNKNAETGAYEDLVYQGEAKNVSLTKGGDNTALVTVSPATEGNGYIKIGTITFVPKKSGDQAAQLKFISVTNPDGSAVEGISYDASTATYTVPTGAYKVTVKFANAAQTVVYGEGYVIATVYPNLTTTIGGDLSELVTYAQFDAEQNPDAVKVQAVSAEVGVGTGTAVAVSGSTGSGENLKTVSTSIARADVNKIIEQMAAEQAIPATPTGDGASTKVKLALNVDPTEATETSVTYEIGMEATLTYKASSTAAEQVSNKPITALDNAITIEISMQTGLSSVLVKHSGNDMTQGTSATTLTDGQYFYDSLEGKLYICTSTFSPFAISYSAPANYVAMVGDAKYSTLAAAVQKVAENGTVKLIADVALPETLAVEKTFTLDLNGFNITADGFRAIWVKEGGLKLTGKGIVTANGEALNPSSSVIRVGDDAGDQAQLWIDKDVTITSSRAYGVTLFGRETDAQYLLVDGKIKVTGTASAISGNGSSYYAKTMIRINDGAEVYAENDYAIYHPERGDLAVEGGKITGKGGIEVKGGRVLVYGGVITATASSVSHTEYNNGASTSGYALASVENANYPGSANIFVKGGTINGKIIAVVDNAAEFDPAILISGGKFSEKPSKDYIKVGYKAAYNEETGYYEIVTVVLTLVEAVDSTCEDEGHHTYWLGDDDNKYILDGENLWIATETDLVIAPHHHWVYSERSEIPDAQGLYSVEYECQVCGETKVVDGWKLVQIESNESETPVNLWSYLEPLTKTDLSGEKTIFELGSGLYTVRSTGGQWISPKELYLRTECIIVGSGSEKTTIQISNDSWWKKGIQLYNRYQNESGIPQSNYQFAGLTIEDKSQDASKDWHLLLITSYGVELGLNDVVFKGFVGTTNIGLWDNQTLTGGKYPTKADEQGVYISMKDVKIVDSVKPFIQNQSFTAANIAGQSDCYASIHILVDDASGEYLSLATQSGNNIHDGIHTEWFVNGVIARVPGTTGIYAPTEVAELQ